MHRIVVFLKKFELDRGADLPRQFSFGNHLTCRLYTIMHYYVLSVTLYTFRTNQNYDPVYSTRHIL